MVVYEVVAYGRWLLKRSGRYERVDCMWIDIHMASITNCVLGNEPV